MRAGTLPLFEVGDHPVPDDPQPAPPVRTRPNVKAQYAEWRCDLNQLADAWEELHVWFLQRQLRLLACVHTEDAERADILNWLETPIISGRPAPFNAQACLGLYDPRINAVDFQRQVRVLSQRIAVAAQRTVA